MNNQTCISPTDEGLYNGGNLRNEPNRKFQKPLTPRQKEVAFLAALGYRNKDIAPLLHITESTVIDHLYSTFSKLNIRSRVELLAYFASRPNSLPISYRHWISKNRELIEQLSQLTTTLYKELTE